MHCTPAACHSRPPPPPPMQFRHFSCKLVDEGRLAAEAVAFTISRWLKAGLQPAPLGFDT